MTFREYMLMCKGYETRRAHDFEHTRAIVYAIAASNRDGSKAFPTIQKFWPLSTDSNGQEVEMDDLNATRARLVEYYNSHFGKNLA